MVCFVEGFFVDGWEYKERGGKGDDEYLQLCTTVDTYSLLHRRALKNLCGDAEGTLRS